MAQLDSDRIELQRQRESMTDMLKSYTEVLLKALEFWSLKYADKYEKWQEDYLRESRARRRSNRGFDDDEGYFED